MGVSQSLRSVVGLFVGADDEYGEYESYDDETSSAGEERECRYEERSRVRGLSGSVGPDFDDSREGESSRRMRPSHAGSARPLALVHPLELKFGLLAPRTFDEAQQIADRFRAGAPVIVDLQACGPQLAKRLVDFCSGLAYALEGRLQLVEAGLLLLAPQGVDVSGEATVGLRERGFFNQV